MRLLLRAETALVRVAFAVLSRLSIEHASALGGAVARTIGPVLPVSRVADANLRAALPALDARARRRIVRGVWDNLGRTMGEFPHLGALSRRETLDGPGFVIENASVMDKVAREGGTVILYSGHIGNWELLPRAAASFGLALSSFYRAPANPDVETVLNAWRSRALGFEVPMFRKGSDGARQAFAHLARGGCLGVLADQKLNDGIEARLFGMPAMTAPAAATFALRFGCPLIGGRVLRVAPGRYRITVEPPLPLPATGDRAADTALLTQAVNDVLERWIREAPESWLWLHRRWPKTVVKA